MSDEKSFESRFLDFLINHSHSLFAALPLALSDLFERLCVQGIDGDLASLERLCFELTRYLPASFVIEPFQGALDNKPQLSVMFFDKQVLKIWKSNNSIIGDGMDDLSRNSAATPDKNQPPVLAFLNALCRKSTTLANRQHELLELITGPTAEQTLLSSLKLSVVPKPYTEICPNEKRSECLKQGKLDCLRKIHFEPIITSSTDPSIGDCSYLDTCYKGKGCKYVHYKIVYPGDHPKHQDTKLYDHDNVVSFYYSENHTQRVSTPCE